MKILQNIEAKGFSLWLPKNKALILADFHIGYEQYLNEQGIFIPRHQFRETKEMLEKLLSEIKPNTIIINGDMKHEFGEISRQEWHETLAIFDLLLKHTKKIILIKGNHDTILEPLARKKKIEIENFFCINDICILHGHKIFLNAEIHKSKILIIGHEHPAISLREGSKIEQYKCFLLGSWQRKKLIVMPSFLPIIEGTDIKKEKLLSPYLKQSLSNFEVFIVSDKVYKFGKLKDL